MSETRSKRKVEFIESYWTGGEYGSDYRWNDNHGVLVRCKDCKFRQSRVSRIIDGKECNLCEMVKGYKPADWYCADGERR